MSLSSVPDRTAGLAAAAAAGDQDAFGVLVEERWAYLVRLARSVVGDLEAEDAVQDALLSAWHEILRRAAPGRFRSRGERRTLRLLAHPYLAVIVPAVAVALSLLSLRLGLKLDDHLPRIVLTDLPPVPGWSQVRLTEVRR